VDQPDTLKLLCTELARISERPPLIFPIHPRTRANQEKFGLNHILADNDNIRLIDPLGYIHFMNLVFNARLLITDSGGVQEETTCLGTPSASPFGPTLTGWSLSPWLPEKHIS
jgi:UDP-N-acetylglucosamine 2-epimerase (non-hydrolysing)